MKLLTAAALTAAALALSGCSDAQINKTLATLTGELDTLQQDRAALQAQLDQATASNLLTDVQRADLQQRLDALETRLADK